jgi:hypothetical protein
VTCVHIGGVGPGAGVNDEEKERGRQEVRRAEFTTWKEIMVHGFMGSIARVFVTNNA